MYKYKYRLKDGREAEIFNTDPHLDSKILEYEEDGQVKGITLWNCGIVDAMPFILRYCFEQGIDLRKRKFLENFLERDYRTDGSFYEIDDYFIAKTQISLEVPLKTRRGKGVRSIEGKLIINSEGEVSFDPEDVPELIEGIVRGLNNDGIRLAQIKCIQAIQHYHHCLDNGVLSKD